VEGAGDKSRIGGDERVRRRGVVTVVGGGATRKAGKGVMTCAGVGGGEDREEREGREGGEVEKVGRGLMAERSASRGDEGVTGTTRVRPSNLIVWSLFLSQHG
jgi:hypothetical protein